MAVKHVSAPMREASGVPPTDATRPTVAVVMLTMNQREMTLRALESLGESRLSKVQVVLWDNASTDDTLRAVQERFPEVVARHSMENRGVAGGRNDGAGVAIARWAPDYLCFLDNDLVLTPGFIDALLQVLLARPEVGQVQAKLRFLDRPTVLQDGGGCHITFWLGQTASVGVGEEDRGQRDQVTDCVSGGGAMMVRTALFQALGGFDEIFNPFGPEDIDFSLRLQRRGHRALYVPTAMAYHAVSHSFEPGGYSTKYAKLKAQHWLRFLGRHGTPLQKLAFFGVGMPVLALKLLVREGRKGNLGAVAGSVRGVLASLRRKG